MSFRKGEQFMQPTNKQLIKCGIKTLTVVSLTAACILIGTTGLSSGKPQHLVYAENQSTYVLPSAVITAEASFESSFEPTVTEIQYDTSGISAATSIASDFEEIEQPVQTVMRSTPVNITNLNAFNGVCNGPSGKETYYNLPMSGVVRIMRQKGYDEQSYPYWVRDDGVKMFGDYIMVAADLSTRPKGTILECSLGTAMVVDTGEFVNTNPMQLDIAVTW